MKTNKNNRRTLIHQGMMIQDLLQQNSRMLESTIDKYREQNSSNSLRINKKENNHNNDKVGIELLSES